MAKQKATTILRFGDGKEDERRQELISLMRKCPIPDHELLLNMGLFLVPQTLSRILFMDFLYRKILETQGVILEFGCRWGQNLSLFSAMRGIYEPFNRLRRIVGFDTFQGFPSVSRKDGALLSKGGYAVTQDYEKYLERILALQEQESPQAHLRRFEVIKGDACVKLRNYLKSHLETVVALAYFDMDLYKPTRECLLAIKNRLTIGSVIGFDEANDSSTPGETAALLEVLGLNRFALKRFPHNSRTSYLVIDKEIK